MRLTHEMFPLVGALLVVISPALSRTAYRTCPARYYVRLIAPAKLAGGLRIVHASCAAPPPVWRGVLSSLWLPPQGSGMMCPQTGTDPYARVEGRGNGLLRPARPSR